MVLFFEWHQIAVEPKNRNSCVPMSGEDTGLEPLALPLAGYLGKVQERAESLEYCPWCTSKGFSYALRSYHINLQESITLCTNPQCLFPLVTRPLEDVLSDLVPTVGAKRKNTLELEKKDMIGTPLKRLRPSKVVNLELQQQLEHGSVNLLTNGLHPTPKTQSENVDGNRKKCVDTETESWDTLQDENIAPSTGSASFEHSDILLNGDGVEPFHSVHLGVNGTSENSFKEKGLPVLNGSSRPDPSRDISMNIKFLRTPCSEQTTSTEEKSLIAAFTSRGDTDGISCEDLSLFSPRPLKELVSIPKQLLWKNSDNLCWLDSLLAVLVNCKTLRRCKPKDEPHHSPVWQLIKGYEDICAAVQMHQQTGRDGVVRVPGHVLQKADADLQSLRMSVFNLLQPKLHCILGQRETPVFAMPLLLTMDSWVEHLFQSTFHWEFKCSQCEVVTKEKVMKTLPTFTNIVPDWHPLQAVHFSQCNVCGKKNQMRTMMLESVPPVFALHFVEGLPDCDVTTFTFQVHGKRYSVTTVIQYSHRLKHFVTWIWNDGAWLEYDDLNHTDVKTHQKLQIPAHEMHVVFWEVEEDADPPAGSPLNTLAEQPAPEKERTSSLHVLRADESVDRPQDQSLLALHDDTDIVDALTEEDVMDTAITADTSIGSTTLLDAFEGLNHNDIITLTLVEVDPADSGSQLLKDGQRTRDASAPTRTERPEPSPDSSLPAAGGDVCHSADVEPPATLSSSNSESVDGSSTDATPAPAAKIGRRRGTSQKQTISKQRGRGVAVSEEAPQTSPPAPSELPIAVSQETIGSSAPDNTLSGEVAQLASPKASTDTSPLSTSQKSPPIDYNARWSFLLSKHPLTHLPKSISNPAPTQRTSSGIEVKSFQPIDSTPSLTTRQMIPSGLPTPQLITTESMGLPPKAAGMYGGFGTKSSTNHSPLPSPPLSNGNAKLSQTIPANHLAPPMVMPLNKHGSYSSKVPPGLGETEALRYKLMKKLKAKKKKLAKLNQLLGHRDRLQPDSTALNSPSTVASSTYDSSGGNDFLSDLLSPATTASNLSPDSTGFLEMLAGGQEGADNINGVVSAAGAASQTHCSINEPETENFLEDFLFQCCGFEAN